MMTLTQLPDGYVREKCPRCNGTGTISIKDGGFHNNLSSRDKRQCPRCTNCMGDGFIVTIRGSRHAPRNRPTREGLARGARGPIRNQKRMRDQSKADKIAGLHGAVAVASTKRGKSRKAKK